MPATTFQRMPLLLTCAIATAVFFTTLILLDYFRVETQAISIARELLLLPFFLILIALPFFLIFSLVRNKYNRTGIWYALITWISTVVLIILKTFFFY